MAACTRSPAREERCADIFRALHLLSKHVVLALHRALLQERAQEFGNAARLQVTVPAARLPAVLNPRRCDTCAQTFQARAGCMELLESVRGTATVAPAFTCPALTVNLYLGECRTWVSDSSSSCMPADWRYPEPVPRICREGQICLAAPKDVSYCNAVKGYVIP